jgi:hypothetical protein
MVEQWLMDAWWGAALLWSVVYISDYAFSVYNAGLYRRGAHQYFEFEGSLELTPQFQEDIDNLRWFSPRFIRAFIFSNIILSLVWWLAVEWAQWPETFLFAFGGMMLLEAAVHLRHFRLLVLFMQLTSGQGMKGKIFQSRWLGYQASGWEFIAFAGLCLLLSIVAGSWFILGGAFMSAVTGVQHLRWGKRPQSHSKDEAQGTFSL